MAFCASAEYEYSASFAGSTSFTEFSSSECRVSCTFTYGGVGGAVVIAQRTGILIILHTPSLECSPHGRQLWWRVVIFLRDRVVVVVVVVVVVRQKSSKARYGGELSSRQEHHHAGRQRSQWANIDPNLAKSWYYIFIKYASRKMYH